MTESTQPPPFALATMRWFRKFGRARGLVRAVDRTEAAEPLVLYSLEGCGKCRRVREALTELDLDYLTRSCPFGSDRNRAVLRQRGGKAQVPYLIDPNTGVELYESRDIVAYLESRYGNAVGRDAAPAAAVASGSRPSPSCRAHPPRSAPCD